MVDRSPKRKSRPGGDGLGRTALHHAAADSDISAVQRLLAEGADALAQDDNGWCPLHFAAQAASPEITNLLLDAGAEVDTQNLNGNTPLFTAVFASRGDGEVIRILRKAGANPSQKNHHGVSPVDLARNIANYAGAHYFSGIS